jgi:hypothetical protein
MYVLGFWQHDQWFVLGLFPVVIATSISIQLVYNQIKIQLKSKWSKNSNELIVNS